MNSSVKRKKTDNAHFAVKVAIRKQAISNLNDVNVLDCFAGKNRLWKATGYDSYLGIEKVKGKGTNNIYGDNLRIIPSLDLSSITVVDIDSYGVPASQLMRVVENATCPKKLIIVYTAISSAVSAGQKELIEACGIPYVTYRKCPMLFNKHVIDMFYNMLYKKYKVDSVNRIVMNDGSYEKHYGYFVLTLSR